MKLGMEVGFGPGHTVLDGDPAPTKGVQTTQFLAHVCCGQTDGSSTTDRYIKMPLGTDVGLGSCDIVLDEDATLLQNGRTSASPTFRPMSTVDKRLDG